MQTQVYKLLLLLVVLCRNTSHAQTLSPKVICNAGGYYTSSVASLSWTVGETITPTIQNGGLTLTQGFQQTYKLNLKLKAWIQGYYAGSGVMEPVLYNEGQANGLNDADTITVELHKAIPPYTIMHSYTGVLKIDGTITCNFPNASEGQLYYIVVKHRNSVGTWSANPVTLSSAVYDFTSAAQQAYGANEIEVANGVFALYSGDINQDENTDLLDLGFLEQDISDFAFGYVTTDINGDGNVDLLDMPLIEGNINNFIYAIHP